MTSARRLAVFAAAFFRGLVVLACLPPSGAQASPRVVATILPLHALAASVMAGVGVPILLLKPGTSPHHYSLRPMDARTLGRADVIIWVGPRLERFLVKPLANLASTARLLSVAEGNETDTHPWLDPRKAIAMIGRIAQLLATVDPPHANVYRHNAETMSGRLGRLDAKLAKMLAGVRGRAFMTYHDAFSGFARHYGLDLAGALMRIPDHQPGARTIAAARARMERGRIRCLFVEPQSPPPLARMLVAGTAVHLAAVDPLGAGLAPGADAYARLLEQVARAIRDCLDPK